MTSLTDVFVTVKPDMDKFGPEVKNKLSKIDAKAEGSKVAGRFGVGFNGAFGGIVKHSAGLFVGAFAAIKGAQIFGGFINDARESAKVARLSAAVIKSTGGVAGITAAQIGDLATAISNKTGADDEAIQSGENLLATFTNIRNKAGAGNDIFNRATQSAVDLAAAMNNGVVDANGLKSANIQLGKALNDPVKGVTALSKVGVSFTAQQKEQIKALVKSGDVLGAQKVILGEVGKEFGGAAAAAADPLTRLTTIGGNLAEKIGGFLLPAVGKFATFVGDKAVPAISALFDLFHTGDFTTEFREAFHVEEDSPFVNFLLNARDTAISVFNEIKGGVIAFGAAFKANDGDITSSGLPGFMERLGFVARQSFEFFKTEVLPRLKDFAGFVIGNVIPSIKNLVAAFTPLARDVGEAAVDIFQKLSPLFVSIGTALVGSVLPAIKSFTGFLKDNSTLVGAVAAAVGGMVAAFYAYHFALGVVSAATKAYAAVQAALNFVMSLNPIGVVILALVGLAAGLVYAYKKSETFRDIVNGVWASIQTAAKFMWENVLKPIFGTFVAVLQGVWKTAQTFATNLSAAWNAIKEPARVALKFVADRFFDMVGALLTGAAKAFGWVPGVGDKLRAAATEFGKFRDSVNAKLDGIDDQTITIKPVFDKNTMSLASAGRRATGGPGGPVDGPGTTTSDTAGLYALSRKEWVIQAKSSMKYGDYAMQSVNEGRATIIPDGGFARGGSPGVTVRPQTPTGREQNLFASSIAGSAKAIGQSFAPELAKLLGVNPGLASVLSFVKSQVGKPYLWGGVGPGGYDCSGLVSAAINTAFGRNPYRRLGATGSMPWSMFAPGPGAFEVGWFQGNPGHTAATVNGVHIESSGGRGVHMGSGARGARDGLFTNRAHVKGFADGGRVGDAPYDTLHNKKKLMKELGIDTFDTGGLWRSGTVAANMSGRTETVRTASQEASLRGGQVGMLTITNWQDGTGHFRLIARDEIGSESEFNNAVGRMHR